MKKGKIEKQTDTYVCVCVCVYTHTYIYVKSFAIILLTIKIFLVSFYLNVNWEFPHLHYWI